MTENYLLQLPLEILYIVLDLLDLASIYQLGAACRGLHRIIHQDDNLWRRRVRRQLQIRFLFENTCAETEKSINDINQSDDKLAPVSAIIQDPTLHGNKELFLLHSKEFQKAVKTVRSDKEGKSEWEKWFQFIQTHLNNQLHKSSRFLDSFHDGSFQPRLALFGPGIESPRTKHLVHRMVQAHNSSFNAIDFVAGLPGGFGSGVRIDFQKMYTFDLMCLYTNSSRVRSHHKGSERLIAGETHNRLLSSDYDEIEEKRHEESEKQWLHENVLKLLPTLNALIFAVDATESDLKLVKSELNVMKRGMKVGKPDTPLLVLCCYSALSEQNLQLAYSVNSVNERTNELNRDPVDVETLADAIDMSSLQRPWAVFFVDIDNMNGLEKALSWVLYHIYKQKNVSEFHKIQGKHAL